MTPHIARVDPVRETFFGTTVEDPYRWMEDATSDEFRAWLEAQNVYTRAYLDALPGRHELRDRLIELSDTLPLVTEVKAAGGRTFYRRRRPGENLPSLVVREEDGSERVLLDPNESAATEPLSLGWYFPSPDGRFVAFGLNEGGSENNTLFMLETETGRRLDLAISRVRYGHVSWLDNETFLYHRLADLPPDAPAMERRWDSRMYLHHIDADPAEDQLVFGRDIHPDIDIRRRLYPIIVASPESDWMIGLVYPTHGLREPAGDFTIYSAPRADLADPIRARWRKVCDAEDRIVEFALHDDTIYLRTYKDAPRFKIVATSLEQPDLSRARAVVSESRSVIQEMRVVDGYLVTRELDGGIARLRRTPLGGGDAEPLPLPFDGTITAYTQGAEGHELLLSMTGWTEPPRIYRYDVRSRAYEDTGWIPPPLIDFSTVEAREVHIPSHDGTMLPLSIIHRKGLALDGSNPTILLGYGSYGLTQDPVFRPDWLAWYERGGVLAVGHIRGGGEYGRAWHEAGRLLNKQNTIDDFIACAEWLIDKGYTSTARLAGMGGSAGGIPTGGALVKRPDLWAAMLMLVPVTNAMRSEFTENGPPNVPEFGTVTTEDGFRALQIIDSYHKVQDGVAYPAVLLTTGLNDTRVDVWQAAKMAARLQAATTSGKPVLLRVETQAGHGIGSTRQQLAEELADELAFVLAQMGGQWSE